MAPSRCLGGVIGNGHGVLMLPDQAAGLVSDLANVGGQSAATWQYHPPHTHTHPPPPSEITWITGAESCPLPPFFPLQVSRGLQELSLEALSTSTWPGRAVLEELGRAPRLTSLTIDLLTHACTDDQVGVGGEIP
jgi:hypothetical protein